MRPTRLHLRCTDAELDAWRHATARDGRTLSDWIRRQLNVGNWQRRAAADRETERVAVTLDPRGTVSTLAEAVLDDLPDLSIPPGTPPAAAGRSRRRGPLVYPTATALEQARLMPGRLLAREVERAIVYCDVDASERGGFVFLDERGVGGHCVRESGRLRRARERGRSCTLRRIEGGRVEH